MSARRRSAPSADQRPPRVVLDTNVVLSALVFRKGTTARLRAAWQGGHCLPLVSAATAQELMRVLSYPKFRLDAHCLFPNRALTRVSPEILSCKPCLQSPMRGPKPCDIFSFLHVTN